MLLPPAIRASAPDHGQRRAGHCPARSAVAYFTLANSGGRDRLVSVEAAGVGQAGLHETTFSVGIMRMRPLKEGLEIPANGRVLLSASGRHVMIERIAGPLAAGSHIRLTLKFERQGTVTIDAPVARAPIMRSSAGHLGTGGGRPCWLRLPDASVDQHSAASVTGGSPWPTSVGHSP